ncbi:MAG: SDR family oxidoreductase, partial [Alphaproteobacteria bacterium]|nr:SDR family oxidoreductase [Alphaproteobacteria bacterium]
RAAVITSSVTGMGFGIALALAKEGVHIMLNGLADEETIRFAKERLAVHGVRVEYSPADVSSISDIEEMIDETVRCFGAADIVVNNVSMLQVSPVDDFPLDKWDTVLATNLFSAFYATRKVLPIMKAKSWGRIVNVSFDRTTAKGVNNIAYLAAQHGVVGFTKVTATETAGAGITCNVVCPINPASKDQTIGVPSKSREIGELVVFLCSDAGASITGSAYTIDAGWSGI